MMSSKQTYETIFLFCFSLIQKLLWKLANTANQARNTDLIDHDQGDYPASG